MKRIVALLLITFFHNCETKNSVNKKELHTQKQEANYYVEKQKYFIGDINNDKINDTAYISITRNKSTNEIQCNTPKCTIDVTISGEIPKISLDESEGVYVKKTEDINHDKANEILLFSRTHEGYWDILFVYSFHHDKWHQLAKTRVFVGEDSDFENRIQKINSHFYLIGDEPCNDDENLKKTKQLIQ